MEILLCIALVCILSTSAARYFAAPLAQASAAVSNRIAGTFDSQSRSQPREPTFVGHGDFERIHQATRKHPQSEPPRPCSALGNCSDSNGHTREPPTRDLTGSHVHGHLVCEPLSATADAHSGGGGEPGYFARIERRLLSDHQKLFGTPLGPSAEYWRALDELPQTVPGGRELKALGYATGGGLIVLDGALRSLALGYNQLVNAGCEALRNFGSSQGMVERCTRDFKAMPEAFAGSPGALRPGRVVAGKAGTAPAARFTPPTGFVPRLDLAEQFAVRRRSDDWIILSYRDTAEGHGLSMHVERGIASFSVRAEMPELLGSGRDMVHGALRRLDQEGVEVRAIEGHWTDLDSVNARQYYANRSAGMRPEDAARNTWTGRIAADYGFTKVEVEESLTLITPRFSR